MNSIKYLFKNIGLLTISQFATKLLTFFLVPLYTSVLSTAEYGTYDLLNSTIALLVPILTLNICDSTLRFSINNKNNLEDVVKISFHYLLGGICLVFFFLIINRLFLVFPIINDYEILFFMMFFGSALNGIISSFARGMDFIKNVAIAGILGTAITLLLNVLFLVPLQWGIKGYFLANIIGPFSQSVYLICVVKIWKYLHIKRINNIVRKDMLKYSVPLMINNISWWINNVADRYIITLICGIAANGIYSVSYKIPSILMIFQGVFNQAWTLSVVKDYDKNDSKGFFSKLYNQYNMCMILICSLLILMARIIAHILYAKDFYVAWKYAPFLLISVVFGAMAGYIGGIFTAVKDSKIFAQSTVIGAIVNIVLNIILVSHIGAIGAALATAVSYVVVWLIRIKIVKKYMNLKINIIRDSCAYLLLLVQTIVLYVFDDSLLFFSIESVMFLIIVYLFKFEMNEIISYLSRLIKNQNLSSLR